MKRTSIYYGLLCLLIGCADLAPGPFDTSVKTKISSYANDDEAVLAVDTLIARGGRIVNRPSAYDVRSYFIEFRSRAAASYGHLYVIYGTLDTRGNITESQIAGLHPAGDTYCENCSVIPWMIGHVVFVPAETGASDGDQDEKYVTSRFRIYLDEANFERVAVYIQKLKRNNLLWNALWRNCVSFGHDIANFIGLKTPGFFGIEPKQFVDSLRIMNGNQATNSPNSLGRENNHR